VTVAVTAVLVVEEVAAVAVVEQVDTRVQAALGAAHPLEQVVGLALEAEVAVLLLAVAHHQPAVEAEGV
jgi:hypothetical protein